MNGGNGRDGNNPGFVRPVRGIPHFPNFSPQRIAQGRPPGSPPNAPGPPRLPGLPAPPYSPPIVPFTTLDAPQISQGLSDPTADYESANAQVLVNEGDMQLPVHVYTTNRRWRGVDVFLQIDPSIVIGQRPHGGANGSAAITVQLWAISRGVRTLVATGRYGAIDQVVAGADLAGGRAPNIPKRLIAYRGPSEKFEVTCYSNFTNVTAGGFSVQFGVIATDQAVPLEDGEEVGLIATNPISYGGLQTGDVVIAPDNPASVNANAPGQDFSPIELVWIFAASSVASRWLQVFALPPGAGQTPIASFGPFALGGVDLPIRFPKGFRFRGTGFGLYWSSTAATFTSVGAGDSASCAWYR